MSVYYNENDPRAAAWLRELMRAGAIPEGMVDERSIEDIAPADLTGFRQCHFFAGIGGWPLALRMAGWPETRPVWTGSCPCQPFSQAGARLGVHDPRHLWPIWRWLIDQCRPLAIFGEQVASADGREWLAGVRADLDLLDYAFGATDLCAAGVGAPHIRQRNWWVAYREGERRKWWPDHENERRRQLASGHCRKGGGLADADGRHAGSEGLQRGGEYGREPQDGRPTLWMGDASGPGAGRDAGSVSGTEAQGDREGFADGCGRVGPVASGADGGLADAGGERSSAGIPESGEREARIAKEPHDSSGRVEAWTNAIWIPCVDGKARRIEPGLAPLADGIPGRVGLLRGYGNAIVPQVAATFIEAAMKESLPHTSKGENDGA